MDTVLNLGRSLEDDAVIQSPNDKRKYRVIVLGNGLKALLVSDIDLDSESSTSSESDKSQPQQNIQNDVEKAGCSDDENSGSEGSVCDDTDDGSDVSDMETDPPMSRHKKGKKDDDSEKLAAAALCVGIGSFCDPPDVPGLAHFLEHMVFMGSKKYPDENAFDGFIKKHGGNDNAFTEPERTVFYFDVERKFFREALDIFAQFFINPLMKQDAVDREIKAVDSEFEGSRTSDSVRKQQLLGSLAKNGAPMAKFMWGNMDSLKDTPSSVGVDLYQKLKEFHSKYYSSHIMTLTVQAKESLDTLEEWVKDIFSAVPNNANPKPEFYSVAGTFETVDFPKLYRIVPEKNVHQVEITWHLPCMRHLYKYKPLHYVGWLVGHEGTGSVLSYLRKKLWALAIGAGNGESGFEHNTSGSLFAVNITLTDEGLVNVFQVMTVVFEYLEMIRQAGPRPAIYNEIKVIEDNEFRWKEQIDPSDYVEHLSEAMQLYPAEDFLRGDRVVYPYDSQAENSIKQVLDLLVPDKCNVLVLSKTFDNKSTQFKEEYWYKTKYTVEDLPSDYMKRWKKITPGVNVHLPLQNNFIATNFDIQPANALYNKEPKLVLNTRKSRLWYKQDKKFKIPKGFIYFEILSPVVGANAKSQAMFELFVDILSHNLQEVAYNAYVAQMEYEFKVTINGLIIKLNGFSHKLSKLFETIVDHVNRFDVSEELFHILCEQLKKKYFNTFIKPDKLARDLRLMVLEDKTWTKVHKRSVLMGVSRDDLLSFVSEFKMMSFIEGYVHGNFSLAEALEIERSIRCATGSNVLPLSMLPVERVTQLPQQDSVLRVKSFYEGSVNSCVVNYYQVGPSNIQGFITNELLNMMMDEPCFDILRTREQLGYVVYTTYKNTSGVTGICVAVESQASKFSVKQVDDKIEGFLVEFRDRLDSCSDKDFNEQRQSLISIKQCDDSHMGEEADRLWAEIRDKTYLFDRLDREVDELEKLKLDDVRLWFLNTLDRNDAKLRRKLSVQVVGCGERETDSPVESEAFSTLSQSNTVDLSLCTDPLEDCAHVAPVGVQGQTKDTTEYEMQYLEVERDDCVPVSDVSKFKCSLPLHPVSKVL